MKMLSDDRAKYKEDLRLLCNDHVWRTLSAEVHQLNLELFQKCQNIKEKKFRRQPKPHISENTVVKINVYFAEGTFLHS